MRAQLSFTLMAVMTQTLLPRAGAPGRILAMEVMVPNAAIRNLIREDKLHQIYSQMQVGQSGSGMQTMNQALYGLYQKRVITLETAMEHAGDPDEFRSMLEGRGMGTVALRAAPALMNGRERRPARQRPRSRPRSRTRALRRAKTRAVRPLTPRKGT